MSTEGRENGLDQVEIRDYATNTPQRLTFPRRAMSRAWTTIPNMTSPSCASAMSRWSRPRRSSISIWRRGERTVLKVQEIPSGYDPALYATGRLEDPGARRHADSRSRSCTAPITRWTARGRSTSMAMAPMASPIEPGFGTGRLSLVDRGFAFAIAHIRGGDDLGQQWYKDGKLDKRTNTFNDFVDVAKGLDRARLYLGGQDRDVGRLGRRRADGGHRQLAIPSCGARSSRTSPSSTCSTPCSTRRCRSRPVNGPNGAIPSRTRPPMT